MEKTKIYKSSLVYKYHIVIEAKNIDEAKRIMKKEKGIKGKVLYFREYKNGKWVAC